MKYFSTVCIAILLFIIPIAGSGQAPDLGAASSFAVFTAVGAFSNDGNTVVTGDIGTNVGSFTGFPPGIVIGNIHVENGTSAAAAPDVADAYAELAGLTCGQVIGTTLGNNQILTPDIYCLGAASTLNGNLTLDAEGDPDAIFIFQINGALSTTTLSSLTLINGASLCNVYWQINGAVELGTNSLFLGTILANGALSLLEGATLLGRALSQAGAVDMHNNVVTLGLPPVASVITEDGPVTFCAGDSVILSGNIEGTWNNGSTAASITVTIAGEYYVVNTTICGSDTSNHIIITINPLPVCTITGDTDICEGESTLLCATASATDFIWSTGATTSCISVMAEGIYSVTITDSNDCSSTCNVTVTVNPEPDCTITGETFICEGGSTILCTPAGAASYFWNTGAITNCITVTAEGLYTVTVTDINGCSSVCSENVTVTELPICTISGETEICEGESTILCAPAG